MALRIRKVKSQPPKTKPVFRASSINAPKPVASPRSK